MAGWPRNMDDMIFSIQAAGYKPILAHPERYLYEEDISTYLRLKDKGVLIQMNLLSVLGYYGKGVKTLADNFMAGGLYDFCGSDAHHIRHISNLDHILTKHPHIGARLAAYGFKNSSLL
jgi:tyrosine-protein phosphatase YwqE